MSNKQKMKQFIEKKNLNPMNNRKKVGIILFAASIGLFFLFAFRFTYITVVGKVAGVSLKEKTEELYDGSKIIKARRGDILDRYGNPIAEDATSYSLIAILSESYLGEGKQKLYAQKKDFSTIAEILSKCTSLSKDEVLKTLNNGVYPNGEVRFQVEFGSKGKNITLETRQKIEKEMKKAHVFGIYFDEHPARLYPNGKFASHFIGYTSTFSKGKTESLTGKMGIEEAYNDILSGKDGKVYYQKDVYGNPLPGTVANEEKAENGKDIYTTLDVRIQTRLESLMDSANEEYKPEDMSAVLMKAKTGEILAASQRPTFNPETKEGLDDKGIWRNILVEDAFEPGSTIKLFTTAAAIQEGKFDPNGTYSNANGIQLEDRTVWDHDKDAPRGMLTYRQALAYSSNVGMVHLEQNIGGNTWQEYLKKLGFGKTTKSGFLNESAGLIPGVSGNYVDQAMSSFGQAMSATNFQMLQAFTSIADNGTMYKVQYISKIVDKNTGEENKMLPQILGTPFTKQVASTVREYMRDTVEDPQAGIAYNVFEVPNYPISVKTGTAEITGDDGYEKGATAYTYSVVEMVPSQDPEYILYVTMKKPERYAKDTLAKVANPLMKFVMEIKDTTPEPTVKPKN